MKCITYAAHSHTHLILYCLVVTQQLGRQTFKYSSNRGFNSLSSHL